MDSQQSSSGVELLPKSCKLIKSMLARTALFISIGGQSFEWHATVLSDFFELYFTSF